jgi:hypothetical protein
MRRHASAASAQALALEVGAASAKIAQNHWRDADALGTQARAALDVDEGTSVAGTKDWNDLSAKVSALQQKVQPQVARLVQQEAAKAERIAQLDAAKADQLAKIAVAKAEQQALADGAAMLDSILSEYKDNEVRADSDSADGVCQIDPADTVRQIRNTS